MRRALVFYINNLIQVIIISYNKKLVFLAFYMLALGLKALTIVKSFAL